MPGKLAWNLSVFLRRWFNRAYYCLAAPFVYRNWWRMYRARTRPGSTVLELRSGARYAIRPYTTDLAVINEAVIHNSYLGPGHLRLRRDAIVLDVGANIGDFTIQAAGLCPAGHVYAIEPILGNCECIHRQIELNGVHNVTVFHGALGDHDGEIEIHDAGAHSSSLAHVVSGRTERVRLATLASLMRENGIDAIDLLKMDCEGAEWDILPAAESLLPKIGQICLEYHNRTMAAEWLEPWLVQRGFTVRRTNGPWNGLVWAWRA